MTYQQTIDYLYEHLPMFSRIGAAAYKEDLHNTIALCEALNNPYTRFKSIHIAGTNGKGSTSHMLAAILQTAGYKTGLYTSPHLRDFRERIRINGAMIEENFVVDFVERMKALSDAIQPSFFELTVAMAFEYFASQQVDIAIIETGLGGRLDSTNVITPLLSVITNIGFDHMNLLGNTLDKIAFEKAGIIKKEVPVVIGEYNDITLPIFMKKAADCNSPIYQASDLYSITDIDSNTRNLRCNALNIHSNKKRTLVLDLNGLYQSKNLCTVLTAIDLIRNMGFTISEEDLNYGLGHTKTLTGLHGRWDIIATNPTIVLDVAHNKDGIQQVLNQTAAIKALTADTRFHFVMGMVKDKDIDSVLSLLPTDAAYYFTNAHLPRALSAPELQSLALTHHLKGECYEDVNKALMAAKEKAANKDWIIVCGSVFLVGEVAINH